MPVDLPYRPALARDTPLSCPVHQFQTFAAQTLQRRDRRGSSFQFHPGGVPYRFQYRARGFHPDGTAVPRTKRICLRGQQREALCAKVLGILCRKEPAAHAFRQQRSKVLPPIQRSRVNAAGGVKFRHHMVSPRQNPARRNAHSTPVPGGAARCPPVVPANRRRGRQRRGAKSRSTDRLKCGRRSRF